MPQLVSSVVPMASGIGLWYTYSQIGGYVATGLGSRKWPIPMIITGTHNPYLVALSILVAVLASYTALDLGGHVAATRGLARNMWLVAAAITMGGGIWSMHFVAMLAFIMPTPMSYDIGLTTLSLAACTTRLWERPFLPLTARFTRPKETQVSIKPI